MKTTPVVRVDLGSPVPAYRQIANALRALLVGGAFPVGSPLPTVRQLAVDLGVHHNTVAEAYRVLAEEGWLALRRRHGAIVLDRSRPSPPPAARSSLVQRLRELTAEAQAAGLPRGVIAGAMRSIATQLSGGTLLSGGRLSSQAKLPREDRLSGGDRRSETDRLSGSERLPGGQKLRKA